MPREFRTPESYQAERITRAMLASFLEDRGFTGVDDQRRKYGRNESQTIHAVAPSGRDVSMRVKLCWRRSREGKAETYSASQLLANVKDGAWEKSLNAYAAKLRAEGVTDLLKLAVKPVLNAKNDTLDDLIGFDPDLIGRDEAERIQRITSGVKRDPAVRRAVLSRSGLACENPGCGATRDYPGFLDVHHILGVEESDRPWTCVALCPNCHRETHAAPDRENLNLRLLEFARKFSPRETQANQ